MCVQQEDEMAFGKPTRYLQMDPKKVAGGKERWDKEVKLASDEYGGHIVCTAILSWSEF